jgi:hypothetical protein
MSILGKLTDILIGLFGNIGHNEQETKTNLQKQGEVGEVSNEAVKTVDEKIRLEIQEQANQDLQEYKVRITKKIEEQYRKLYFEKEIKLKKAYEDKIKKLQQEYSIQLNKLRAENNKIKRLPVFKINTIDQLNTKVSYKVRVGTANSLRELKQKLYGKNSNITINELADEAIQVYCQVRHLIKK